ncbi:MAG TPA: hypothetical protein VFU21_21530, partial [Kofleriaceae bacterium]|nr:hypothetical protein [Kofleriaceae bacterium]
MRRAPFLLVLFAATPAGAEPARKKPADEVDVEALKSKMVFVHDGRGHYMAVVPFDSNAPLFYGDGKTFYQQRVFGYSHNQGEGTTALNF